jgi:hypothetical protein
MNNVRRAIQIARGFMALGILIYVFLVLWLPSSTPPNPIVFLAFTGTAVAMVVVIFIVRRRLVLPAEASLAINPQDAKALASWRQGYVLIYALCEAIALCGLLLHFLGNLLPRVLPFFLAGWALIMFFTPKIAPDREFPLVASGEGQ